MMSIEEFIVYIGEVERLYKDNVKFFGYGYELLDVEPSAYNDGYFLRISDDDNSSIFFRNGEKIEFSVYLEITNSAYSYLRGEDAC